jgi:hypothetical protein
LVSTPSISGLLTPVQDLRWHMKPEISETSRPGLQFCALACMLQLMKVYCCYFYSMYRLFQIIFLICALCCCCFPELNTCSWIMFTASLFGCLVCFVLLLFLYQTKFYALY